MEDKRSESKKKDSKIDSSAIFSKEDVNINHQPEFDYFKTLGVFEMAVDHVYIAFNDGHMAKFVVNLAVILSAAGLMILMGIGMKYSRHQNLKYYIIRGFTLLTLAQFQYLTRDCLPNFIAWWTTGKKAYISRANLVFQTDILTFTGFAFFFMAFMKKMKLSDTCIMIISIIMNLVAYPLFKIMKSPSNHFLSQLLGYFVMTDAESFFPLCSFFIFVAFGNWMGDYYKKLSNKDKFYDLILIFCLPIVAIYHYVRCYYTISFLPDFNSAEHYMLSPGPDAYVRLMANLVAFAIFYKLDKFLGKTPYFISHCGKNLNQYYMISYVIIIHLNTYLRVTKGHKYVNEWKYSDIFGLMLLFISRILIDLNDKYIHFTVITLKNPMKKIVFGLIWIMSFIMYIYIHPKVEVQASYWNNYLKDWEE